MHVESRAENRRGNLPRHHYERLTGIVLDLEIGLAIHFHTAFVSEQGRIDNACASIESHAGTVGQHHVRFYPQRRRNAYGLRGSNQTVLGVKSTQQPAAADSACRHDRSRSVTRNPQAQSPAADTHPHVGPHLFTHPVSHGIDLRPYTYTIQQFGQPPAVALRSLNQFQYFRFLSCVLKLHSFLPFTSIEYESRGSV